MASDGAGCDGRWLAGDDAASGHEGQAEAAKLDAAMAAGVKELGYGG